MRNMPTVREVVFSVFVALGVGIIAYGITLQSEIGIFLATAMGSFSVAAFAFWDNYASVAKLQIELKGQPDVNFITLTELDKNGDPLFDYHQIRVVVRNRGRKTATGCTGWEDLEMVEEKPPSRISTAQKLVTKGPLARILRYLGLAVLIVVANYVIGILTVNNLSLIPSWVWSLLAIPSISIPFALAFGFKGNRGKRLLVKYTSILVAAEVFVIVKISDTLTSLIPSLFGLSVLNLAVFVAFISIVGCFLWLVDYVKEFPKIVSASLEKKEPDKR